MSNHQMTLDLRILVTKGVDVREAFQAIMRAFATMDEIDACVPTWHDHADASYPPSRIDRYVQGAKDQAGA